MAFQNTDATWSWGTRLLVETSEGSGVYEEIGQLAAIDPPNQNREEADITNFTSPGGVEENIGTIIRVGTVPLTVIFQKDNAKHIQLFNDFATGVKRNYKIQYCYDEDGTYDQGEETFRAWVQRKHPMVDLGDAFKLETELRVTGVSEYSSSLS